MIITPNVNKNQTIFVINDIRYHVDLNISYCKISMIYKNQITTSLN